MHNMHNNTYLFAVAQPGSMKGQRYECGSYGLPSPLCFLRRRSMPFYGFAYFGTMVTFLAPNTQKLPMFWDPFREVTIFTALTGTYLKSQILTLYRILCALLIPHSANAN